MANLMKAKQTMNAVESGNYKVDHTKANAMLQQSNGEKLLESLPDGATPNTRVDRPINTPSEEQISKSRLPDSVKKLMMEQPIPKMDSGGGTTFSLDDVKNMVKSTTGNNQPIPQQQQQESNNNYRPQQVNETVVTNSKGQMLVTLTEAELDKKIDNALMKFMTEYFTKNLKEETIKKTISTLIKEGKLKVKSKTTR